MQLVQDIKETPEGQEIVAVIENAETPDPMPIVEDVIDSVIDPLVDAINAEIARLEGLISNNSGGIEDAVGSIPDVYEVDVVEDTLAPSGFKGNIVEK